MIIRERWPEPAGVVALERSASQQLFQWLLGETAFIFTSATPRAPCAFVSVGFDGLNQRYISGAKRSPRCFVTFSTSTVLTQRGQLYKV